MTAIYTGMLQMNPPFFLGTGRYLSPGAGWGGGGAEDFKGDHTVFKKT